MSTAAQSKLARRGTAPKTASIDELITLYRMAAENAFGWAKVRRGSDKPHTVSEDGCASQEEAEAWLEEYTGGMPSTMRLAQRPGSPLHLIGLAFSDMSRSADEWETWGYRLAAAHDSLLSQPVGREEGK